MSVPFVGAPCAPLAEGHCQGLLSRGGLERLGSGGPELVTIQAYCRAVFVAAYDPAGCHQLQGTRLIEHNRPTHRQFEIGANFQRRTAGKGDATAAQVQAVATPRTQYEVVLHDFVLNRKFDRVPALRTAVLRNPCNRFFNQCVAAFFGHGFGLVCSVFGTSLSCTGILHFDIYLLIRKETMPFCSIFRTIVPLVPDLLTKVSTQEADTAIYVADLAL